MSLHSTQVEILERISDGVNNSRAISEASDLSRDLVLYHAEILEQQGYVTLTEYNDGISRDNDYICRLTSQGRVVLDDPAMLVPLELPNATTINNDLRGASVANFANQLDGNARQQVKQKNYTDKHHRMTIEVAEEMRQLLERISSTLPTSSVSDRMQVATNAIAHIENDPNMAKRVLKCLNADSSAVLKQHLYHPFASFILLALEELKNSSY
ncbi:MAG: hypothetical protein AAFQ63_18140 [Cyanobacteria bacterium J06621_11]